MFGLENRKRVHEEPMYQKYYNMPPGFRFRLKNRSGSNRDTKTPTATKQEGVRYCRYNKNQRDFMPSMDCHNAEAADTQWIMRPRGLKRNSTQWGTYEKEQDHQRMFKSDVTQTKMPLKKMTVYTFEQMHRELADKQRRNMLNVYELGDIDNWVPHDAPLIQPPPKQKQLQQQQQKSCCSIEERKFHTPKSSEASSSSVGDSCGSILSKTARHTIREVNANPTLFVSMCCSESVTRSGSNSGECIDTAAEKVGCACAHTRVLRSHSSRLTATSVSAVALVTRKLSEKGVLLMVPSQCIVEEKELQQAQIKLQQEPQKPKPPKEQRGNRATAGQQQRQRQQSTVTNKGKKRKRQSLKQQQHQQKQKQLKNAKNKTLNKMAPVESNPRLKSGMKMIDGDTVVGCVKIVKNFNATNPKETSALPPSSSNSKSKDNATTPIKTDTKTWNKSNPLAKPKYAAQPKQEPQKKLPQNQWDNQTVNAVNGVGGGVAATTKIIRKAQHKVPLTIEDGVDDSYYHFVCTRVNGKYRQQPPNIRFLYRPMVRHINKPKSTRVKPKKRASIDNLLALSASKVDGTQMLTVDGIKPPEQILLEASGRIAPPVFSTKRSDNQNEADVSMSPLYNLTADNKQQTLLGNISQTSSLYKTDDDRMPELKVDTKYLPLMQQLSQMPYPRDTKKRPPSAQAAAAATAAIAAYKLQQRKVNSKKQHPSSQPPQSQQQQEKNLIVPKQKYPASKPPFAVSRIIKMLPTQQPIPHPTVNKSIRLSHNNYSNSAVSIAQSIGGTKIRFYEPIRLRENEKFQRYVQKLHPRAAGGKETRNETLVATIDNRDAPQATTSRTAAAANIKWDSAQYDPPATVLIEDMMLKFKDFEDNEATAQISIPSQQHQKDCVEYLESKSKILKKCCNSKKTKSATLLTAEEQLIKQQRVIRRPFHIKKSNAVK